MNALDRLKGLLRGGAGALSRPLPADESIDLVIAALARHAKSGTSSSVPEDLQQQAVRRFWEAQRFESLRDARLVSFGMCVPSRPAGPCIMEDRRRFQAVLDSRSGVDQWLDSPRWYRRCYQGLMRSYFTYDPSREVAPPVGRQNWLELREYLKERTGNIVDTAIQPNWVTAVMGNRQLFCEEPCAPYAASLLDGDSSTVDTLCEQLGIIKASWFLRELVLAQVREATKLGHERFKERIPGLVDLLGANRVLRDKGLILILDKYASVVQPAINDILRNVAVEWWGNPWLPSNETRWGGVARKSREMVSEWLKREFVEAFFTKLAEDGVGDRRRANFWLRYVKSMDNIQFALGSHALYSEDRDFVALRKKMRGLYTELKATGSLNNAFVMTMGPLVVVEFGGMGNAVYGYDARRKHPFDMSQPVGIGVDARNSLKHSHRMLWMQHQDGIKGWNRWEEMFEATLKQEFDIKPNALSARVTGRAEAPSVPATAAPTASATPQRATAPAQPGARTTPVTTLTPTSKTFSMTALESLAKAKGLKIKNLTERNGNLWVQTGDDDLKLNKILLDWKFRYKRGKGWWK
jgi:hypothetical protein